MRADTIATNDEITAVIHDNIRVAPFVVAEISEARPNVYYEIGFARGLGKPVFLVSHKDSNVEFDLRNVQRTIYTTFRELREQLSGKVKNLIGAPDVPILVPNVTTTDNPEHPTTTHSYEQSDLLAVITTHIETATSIQDKSRALKDRATVYSALRKLEQAVEDLEEATALDPLYVDALVDLGYLYNNARRFEEALTVLRRAQDIDASNSKSFGHEAYALNGLGRFAEAQSAAEKAINIDQNNLAAKKTREYAIQKLSAPPDDLGEVMPIREIESITADGFLVSVRSYTERGQYSIASDLLDRAIQKEPSRAELFLEKGKILRLLRQNTEALAVFERALAVAPDNWHCQYELAESLSALGRTEESIRSYKKALSLQPDDCDSLVKIGYVLSRSRDNNSAIEAYDLALKLNSNHFGALANRGFTYNLVGKREDALHDFDKILELKQDYAKIWVQKGFTLQGLGRSSEALACVRRALELEPHNQEALKVLRSISPNISGMQVGK